MMNAVSKLILSMFIFSVLFGCVEEDRTDCPGYQGINVYFYSENSCSSDTLYPSDIKDLTIGLFDNNGILVSFLNRGNVNLSANYFETFIVDEGFYSVIAWSGITDENYIIYSLQNGVTKKEDILFRLKRTSNTANSIAATRVFWGESSDIYVSENKTSVNIFEKISVNMQEITNRVTVLVEGIEDDDQFQVVLRSDNGSFRLDGNTAPDIIIDYPAEYTYSDNILETKFTVLKLETVNTNILVVKNSTTGDEIFNGDLLDELILRNPDLNLDCDHDFEIRFVIDDQGGDTYVIAAIYINGWLVHSYETNM